MADRISPDRVRLRHRLWRPLAAMAGMALLVALIVLYRDRITLTSGAVDTAEGRHGKIYPTEIYYGPPHSLAVLPFQMDEDAVLDSKAFLARGFAEFLITDLVRYTELQVTAPGSSLYFPPGSVGLPILAERLHSTNLLTGHIQPSGGGIVITARLFNVKSGRDSWSDSFATSLAQLPAIRSKVSEAVRSAMNLKAHGEPSLVTVKPEVWLLLLEARNLLHPHGDRDPGQAASLFQQALAIEPGLAEAWLGLAQARLDPTWSSDDPRPSHEQAREAAMKALEFSPDLAEAQVLLSRISRNYDWDWQGARRAAEAALKIRPGSAEVLSNASDNEFTFGNFERAIELLQAAIDRDPLKLSLLLKLGLLHEYAGDYDQSLIAYRQLLGLNPDYPAARAYRARVKLAQGKAESALKEAERELDPFWQSYARILALIALERFGEADPLVERMISERAGDAAFQIAEIQASRGDVESAFEWLEQARRQRDGGMSELIGNHFLSVLEADPRWGELLVRIGLR